MIAQYRPDIARVAEETVVNLKGLENSIEALRNDVAWLCQTIGHPEAARLALTPSRMALGAQGVQFGIPQNLAFAPGALAGPIGSQIPWAANYPGASAAFAGFGANVPNAFGANLLASSLLPAYANALLAAHSLQPGVEVPIVPAYR